MPSQSRESVFTPDTQAYCLESGRLGGQQNMACDEALLESVRKQVSPCLIVRTYAWNTPTLSLGVNQPLRDVDILLARYASPEGAPPAVVQRSTGGRAILHGDDISYAFITNIPRLVKRDICSSYRLLNGFVQQALQALDIPVRLPEEAAPSPEADGETLTGSRKAKTLENAYRRSPVCFETRTVSDLVSKNGEKLGGSAQLRRSGGLLQHGSVFLASYHITIHDFSRALFDSVRQATTRPLSPLDFQQFGILPGAF